MKKILIAASFFFGFFLCFGAESNEVQRTLHTGQSWDEAEKLIKDQSLVVLSPRFAMFKEKDEVYRTIRLDENVYLIIATLINNLKISKLMVVFSPGATLPDLLQLEATEITFHSKEEYSVRFRRDLRTPEEKHHDDLEFQRKVKEYESPIPSKEE